MIVNLRGHIGDTICLLPAAKAYVDLMSRNFHGEDADGNIIDRKGFHLSLNMDDRVRELVKMQYATMETDDRPISTQTVVMLDIWKMVEKYGKSMHPTRMGFVELGLPDPGVAVQPEIEIDGDAPAYDYVIAPFANDPVRAMNGMLYDKLIVQFLVRKESICFIGSGIHKNQIYPACDVFDDAPLPFVAGLMRKARKAVITVDSMANRLAHAAGVENHILLCSDVVPLEWGTHPKARVLYGPNTGWKVDDVLRLVP